MSKNKPDWIDNLIGTRLRERREQLGMSQTTLGEQLQVSFQQIQKYEKGTDRIAAAGLFRLARALGVGIGFFFELVEEAMPSQRGFAEDPAAPGPHETDYERDLTELLRLFAKCKISADREKIIVMVKQLVVGRK